MSFFALSNGTSSWDLSAVLQHSAALLAVGATVEILHRIAGSKVSPRLRSWLWSAVVLRSLVPPGVQGLRTIHPQSGAFRPVESAGDFPTWILALWAAGFLAFALASLRYRNPIGRTPTGAESRLLRAAFERLRFEGPSPQVLIGIDDRLRAPAVLGPLRRPRLWLPESWLTAEHEEDLLRALAHELSHLERHDLWRARLTKIWCALFWFHPVAHVAALRLGELREISCDRMAASRMGESPAAYGSWLARLALAERPTPRTGLALGGRPHSLLHRVESVMRSGAFTAPSLQRRTVEVAALAVFLGLVLPPRTIGGRTQPVPVAAEDPGCLELRYQVLAELAKASRGVAASDGSSASLPLGALHLEQRSNPTNR